MTVPAPGAARAMILADRALTLALQRREYRRAWRGAQRPVIPNPRPREAGDLFRPSEGER